MNRSWSGPAVAGLIAAGVAGVLIANWQPGRSPSPPAVAPAAVEPGSKGVPAAVGPNQREYPIGEPVMKNHVQVAAVWLAGVTMEGMTSAPDVIHLEADVKATEDNPNGFAKDEFVPYLKVGYTLTDAKTGARVYGGEMTPMVASDGLHYGASVATPGPGRYRLTYRIDPPSAGGLGRHVGAGGVAPWWEPFDATFDWDVEPSAPALAVTR